jgi:hypothetical protein
LLYTLRKVEDITGLIKSRKTKRERQCNGQTKTGQSIVENRRGTDNAMVKRRGTDKAMVKRRGTDKAMVKRKQVNQ